MKDQPASNDRIEAYLGILESHGNNTTFKTKKSTTEHARAK